MWKFSCYEENGKYVDGYAACDDDKRQYGIVTHNPMAQWYNLLLAAVSFAYVSSFVHFYRAYQTRNGYNQLEEWWSRLVLDYAVSAPIMLSVINVLWGANTITGVIIAPVVLAMLLILSYVLISSSVESTNSFDGGTSKDAIMFYFWVLVALFGLCITPTFVATADAISTTGKNDNEGSAPAFVGVFVVVFMVVFSTFIGPYYIELTSNCNKDNEPADCFIEFSVLSLVAKVTLHAFLGVGVLQQTSMTDMSKIAAGTPPEEPGASLAFAIAGGAVAGGVVMAMAFVHMYGELFPTSPLYKAWTVPNMQTSMSIASVTSFIAVASVVSIGSFASVASIGSILSVSSIGSIGSIHSVGCVGGFFQNCAADDDSGSFVHLPVAAVFNVIFVVAVIKCVRMIMHQSRDAGEYVTSLFLGILVLAVVTLGVSFNSSLLCDTGILFVLTAVVLLDENMEHMAMSTVSMFTLITGCAFLVVAVFVAEAGSAPQAFATLSTVVVIGLFIACGVGGGNSPPQYAKEAAQRVSGYSIVPIVVVYFAITTALLLTAMSSYSVPAIGTYTVGQNLTKYGAGPQKRYIMFDFSTPVCEYPESNDDGDLPSGSGSSDNTCTPKPGLVSWAALHRTDKFNLRMTVHGMDATEASAAEDKVWTVGVERKGKERDVPNLSFEFRDPTKEFDDTDVKPYNVFDKAYSDWWLTFGAAGDTTHMRQMFADKANGVPSVIVDVLTKHANKSVSYEGVALLTPAHKKDLYNDLKKEIFGESKWKCKDGALDDKKNKGSMFQEYNDGNTMSSEFAKTMLNRNFEDAPIWKMKYPKQSLLEDTEKCGEKGAAYLQNVSTTMQSLLNTRDYKYKNMAEFVRTYVWELMLQDTDFPFRSSNYAFNNDTQVLLPGFLWDYNSPSYRAIATNAEFELRNIYPTFAWSDPLPFWQHVCGNQAALFKEHRSTVLDEIAKAKVSIDALRTAFLTPDYNNTFRRSQKRNNDYGTFVGSVLDLVLHNAKDMTTKGTYTREATYQLDRLADRIHYIETNLNAGCTISELHSSDYLIALLSFVLILMFLTVGGLLVALCFSEISVSARFQSYEMLTLW